MLIEIETLRTQLNVILTGIPEDRNLWEDVYRSGPAEEIIYCARFVSYSAAAERLQQVLGSFGEDAIKQVSICPMGRFLSVPEFGTPVSQLQK